MLMSLNFPQEISLETVIEKTGLRNNSCSDDAGHVLKIEVMNLLPVRAFYVF